MIDKEIREKNSSVSVRDYIDFNALFGRSAPVWLDVGCGKGVFSVELAKRHKEAVLVAVERIGNVMVEGALRAVRENISNLRFLCAGAEYLPRFFPPCSVERIFLNFSTPFPKPSNENRRLTYPPFCKIYLSILKEGGTVELKTDDADFFEYSADSLLSVGFCVTERSTDFCSEDNIETEHEKMYRSEGKKILRLVAVKKGASERILGVRSPVVKALAKEFYGSMEASLFLSQTPHFYLEENNLHGCLLCNIKDLDAAIAMTEEFLPFIDNWATNDITATGMKIFSRNTSAVRGFVERWLKSDKAYTVRFGIVCLLSYFLGEAFEESDLNLLASLNVKNEYYVDMAAAWYISVALVKKYDVAVKTLENGIFDVWVHNKAISKALESFRIDLDKKNYLRTLKR